MTDHLKQHAIPYLIVTALAGVLAWVWWSADHYIDGRISAFYDNKGVPRTDVENIRGSIQTINAKLDALADKHDDLRDDLGEIKEDFRTLVRAL